MCVCLLLDATDKFIVTVHLSCGKMGLTDDTGKRCPLLPCPIPNITNTSMHMMQQQQQQQQV